jgi:branched-chain amino acid transport system permease protein
MNTRVVQQGSREHRLWQVLGYGAVAVVVLVIALSQPDYRMLQFSAIVAWAVAILGVNLIIGYGGQMALGQSAFFGLGGYITAILFTDYGWPFLATLPVSAVVGATVGFVLGLPALRIKGLYLALVTLALALAFPSIVKLDQLSSLTGGANGKLAFIPWKTPSWFPLDVSDAGWAFITLSVIGAVLFWLASNAIRSRAGRAVLALRDNQTGAAVSGVHPATWKSATFAVSSAYAAVGGSMLMLAVPIVGPDSGGFLVAITLVTGMVLGGAGTISGAVIGAAAVVWLPELSKDWASKLPLLGEGQGATLAQAVYGLVLIVVVFVVPGGVIAFVRKIRSGYIRFTPVLPAAGTQAQVPVPGHAENAADVLPADSVEHAADRTPTDGERA